MKNIKALFVLMAFTFTSIMPPQGWAQALASKYNVSSLTALGLMSKPGVPVSLSAPFDLAHFKGMVIDPKDPFKFDFIVHQGDEQLTDTQKHQEYTKLIKYFLAALAVPDTDQWVNLSPYEKDRIISTDFGKTEMGRDVLAQDYMLKQLSSSLTNPETGLGQKFWNNVYARVYQQFGTRNVPLNTFNKVWIVPDKATIYEKGNMVYLISSHLKVMTEADYLAMKKHQVSQVVDEKSKAMSISNQVMRQVIIPAIQEEVNEGKNFAPLRQILSGMILATWYKHALKESILARLYANKGKLKGVDQNPQANEKIYQSYLKAYKKGVYNMIKEETDPVTQEVIPRKYFSGGFTNMNLKNTLEDVSANDAENDFAMESSSELDLSVKLNKSIAPKPATALKHLKTAALVLTATLAASNAYSQAPVYLASPLNSKSLAITVSSGGPWGVVIGVGPQNNTEMETFDLGAVDGSTNFTLTQMIPGQTYWVNVRQYPALEGPISALLYPNWMSNSVPINLPLGTQASAGATNSWIVTSTNGSSITGLPLTFTFSNPSLLSSYTYNPANNTFYYVPNNTYGVEIVDAYNGTNLVEEFAAEINPRASTSFTSIGTTNVGPDQFATMNVALANSNPYESYTIDVYSAPSLTNLGTNVLTQGQKIGTKTINGSTNTVSVPFIDLNPSASQRFYQAVIRQYIEVAPLPPTSSIQKSANENNELAKIEPKIFSLKEADFTYAKYNFGTKTRKNLGSEIIKRSNVAAKAPTDAAMNGGIDFAESNLDMQIKRDGKGVPLPISQQNLDNIHIDGLVPEILDIKPVQSTLLFGKMTL